MRHPKRVVHCLKRVLVTGANGFIGRHCLAPLLAAGFDVHAVSRQPRAPQPGLSWYQVDLLASDAAHLLLARIKPTHMLHMAWYATPGLYWTASENFSWVRASLDLLEAFTLNGGQRCVVAGTCAEYDWRYGWCSESVTPRAPATPYGKCKDALCSLLAARAQQSGLSYAWGRIFSLYGPHEYPSRLVSSVICSLLRRQPARCTLGEQVRDFLHVTDVAGAFVTVLNSKLEGTLNIGSGQPLSIKEVVLQIAMQLNSTDLVRLGAHPSNPHDPPLLVADTTRLSSELRWTPSYNIQCGIAATINWWRSELGGG